MVIDEAIFCFEKAIQLKENNIEAYLNLANIYKENKKFNKLIKIYEKILSFNQNDLKTLYNLGSAYLFLGNISKGKYYFEKIIKINSNHIPSYRNYISVTKITKKNDLYKKEIKTYYGIGFDIHRLTKNKKLYLGGIKIPFHSGLKGHSDGDVMIHCIIDALLGALRKKDIGSLYPSNKNKFRNIRSFKMLKPIISDLKNNNCYINNIDINLICERPKVSKYRNKIINSLSRLINIDKNIINLKGKTVEKLGLIGKENAIACEAIVSINKYE